jgi:hypothetical protein
METSGFRTTVLKTTVRVLKELLVIITTAGKPEVSNYSKGF